MFKTEGAWGINNQQNQLEGADNDTNESALSTKNMLT